MPDRSRFTRLRAVLAACALSLLATLMPARAAGVEDLLPVDEAFALTTRATGDGIELRWKIAEGYYLYRHRTSVQADAGFDAGALRLPKGKAYTDEFFGPVETYREELVALLPGSPRGARTVLTVKFQGCADVGVCYPPQTRKVPVVLATANPAPDPFARTAGGAAPGLFGAPAGAEALPLPAEQAFGFEAIAGDGNTILLRFTPARGYYLYRDRTSLKLDTGARAKGFSLGAPRWPPAKPYRDEYFGQVRVYFDQVDVPVPVIRTSPDAATVRLVATLQGCQTDGICYPPMTRTVDVALPRGVVKGEPVGAALEPVPGGGGATDGSAAADVATGGVTAPAAADPALAQSSGQANAATTPGGASPAAAPRAVAAAGAWSALLLALLGGLVLNLMPCVLPVLSLKALSLAESGTPAAARRHALGYTAGVMVSFLALGAAALGLREAGLALGWGFQLQQPVVVAALAMVMFALGLNLSGLWHLGGRWVGAGHSLATRGGLAGDFFTGVLAVVVATPCTAPFMGAALAWAFLAPPALALAVFAMLGLGLALPFVVIGLVPALAARLPRPGAWMETLRQALAFPLYLTAAWLLWVLGRQRGADAIAWALVAAVAIAFAAWAWSRSQHRRRLWSLPALLLSAAALVASAQAIHGLPRPQAAATRAAAAGDASHVAYSAERLAALRAGGRVVFVNMTADWCVTCKANEKTVLGGSDFRDALAGADAVYMKGDWTDVDPAITAFLQSHGAVGVPLYVVYPRSGEPRVLPTVLTPALVREALREAAR